MSELFNEQSFWKRHLTLIIIVILSLCVTVGIVVGKGFTTERGSISDVVVSGDGFMGYLTVNWKSTHVDRVSLYLLHVTENELNRPFVENVINEGKYDYVIEDIIAIRDYDGPFKVVVTSASDLSVRAESGPVVIGRPCSIEICGKSAAGLPASINETGALGRCDQLVMDDKSQQEIDDCYEWTWKMMPKADRTVTLLCEWPAQSPGARQILKKEIPMNADADADKETLVSCGYAEDIGGAGNRVLTYVVDDTGNYGKILKKVDAVAGEEIGGPVALDVNNDRHDEVLWTSTSCAMGYGCDVRFNIYDMQTDQRFYKTVMTASEDRSKVGQATFSANLSEPQNNVFKQFLNADVLLMFPDPVRESMR